MVRRLIKRLFDLYDPDDFRVGGWCGCCGKWLPDELVERDWPYSICDEH